MTGKWQVNNLYDEPDVLRAHGFSEYLAWPGSVDTDQVKGADRDRFWDAVRRESVEETVAFIQKIESRSWDPVFTRNGHSAAQPEWLQTSVRKVINGRHAHGFSQRGVQRPLTAQPTGEMFNGRPNPRSETRSQISTPAWRPKAIMPPKSTWFEPKLRDGLLIDVT
jgi:hypothetical protein